MIFQMQIESANITFHLSEWDDIRESEFVGEMEAEFCHNAIEALAGWEMVLGNDKYPLDKGLQTMADHFISCISALGEIGGEYTVYWKGSCAFWAFHDIAHALKHFHACNDDKAVYGPYEVEEYMEMEANEYAVEQYISHGGNATYLIEEIWKMKEAHEIRFRNLS
jgi:hypothetical protein